MVTGVIVKQPASQYRSGLLLLLDWVNLKMRPNPSGGYQERSHTADWALDVWAPDMPGLLWQAARGMYALMQATTRAEEAEIYRFETSAPDRETLLVTFLSELLYFTQRDDVAFQRLDLTLVDERLTV